MKSRQKMIDMTRKNILSKVLCTAFILLTGLLCMNNLSADDLNRSKNKKKSSRGEDGTVFCHCSTSGVRCWCIKPPAKTMEYEGFIWHY